MPRSSVVGIDAIGFESESCKSLDQSQRKISAKPFNIFCSNLKTGKFLAVNGIEHTKTKARHPQTNGICERFHKTILNEFYQSTFRKKIYGTIEDLQKDLDDWVFKYNNERTHQGKICLGRTPMQTLLDGKEVWENKRLDFN